MRKSAIRKIAFSGTPRARAPHTKARIVPLGEVRGSIAFERRRLIGSKFNPHPAEDGNRRSRRDEAIVDPDAVGRNAWGIYACRIAEYAERVVMGIEQVLDVREDFEILGNRIGAV